MHSDLISVYQAMRQEFVEMYDVNESSARDLGVVQ